MPTTVTFTVFNESVVTTLGVRGPAGQGVPAGGTTGQVLKKASGDDYDTAWEDESGGGGGGAPTTASYLTLGTNGTLSAERVLTAGTGITLTDAGAGSTLTVAVTANTYQPLDADLTAIAGLTSAADSAPYFTGSGTAALMTVTSAARTVLDDTTVAAMVNTLFGASSTGTGGAVRANAPTLSAPVATSLRILNATGTNGFTIDSSDLESADHTLDIQMNAGDWVLSLAGNLTVSAAANVSGTNTGDQDLSGYAVLSGTLAQFAATTSAELAGVISDETGSGALVFANSPTLVTPNLGTPSAAVLTNASGTAASLTAGKATVLATARTINGVSFDGSGDITVTAAGSTLSDTVPVTKGGTGNTSATAYALLAGGTTSTGAFQSVSGVGTTGQALISNGAGALPTWQTLPGGGDALTTNPLSQFAATTSAQLRGVLSDETGTGAAYFQGGDLGTPSAGDATNLTGTAAGLTAGTATLASTVAVADTTDSTCWVVLVESQTGNQAVKSDGGLTYNASTGALAATSFVGSVSGASVTVSPTGYSVLTGNDAQELFDQTDAALLRARQTGVLYGGIVSADGGIGTGSTVSVTAGVGGIVDYTVPDSPDYTAVTFGASSGVTISASGATYLYVDSAGTLQQTTTAPTAATYRTRIWLASVSRTGGVITAVANISTPIASTAASLHDLSDALGPMRVSGSIPQASGANLKLKISSGVFYDFGAARWLNANAPNTPEPPTFDTGVASVFRYITTAGVITTDYTDVRVANYQVGGVETAIPGASSRVGIHYIFGFPSGNTRLVYGTAYYTSFTDALNALGQADAYASVPGTVTRSNSFVLGAILARKDATNLSDTAQATFVTTNQFGEFFGATAVAGSGYLQISNNLSELTATQTTARTNLGLGTGDSPQFTAVNIGAATDTTVTRVSAGVIAVEGATVYTQGGDLGTPSAGVATNLTGTASGLMAGKATVLATARTIGGTSFDGSANIVPATITVADTTDSTCFVGLWESATGDLAPKTDGALTYNATTGALASTSMTVANLTVTSTADLTGVDLSVANVTATGQIDAAAFGGDGSLVTNVAALTAATLATPRTIGGVSFDGSANIVPQTITSANEGTDTTCFPLFITASGTQSLQPKNNTALTFNSSTGALGATSFTGSLTGATGLPISTGVSGLGTGVATFLATPSSANLASAVTDETGSGALVFATSPTLVTPLLGTPTSGTLTNCTGLPAGGLVAGSANKGPRSNGTTVSNTFPAGDLTTATDGATVTFDLGTSCRQIVTLGGNRTLALSNDADGMAFTLVLKQDGTGNRTVSWFSGIKWPGGTTPTLTTTAGKYDVFAFLRIASGEYLGFAGSLNH